MEEQCRHMNHAAGTMLLAKTECGALTQSRGFQISSTSTNFFQCTLDPEHLHL